jgi:hypothetical protein
MSRRRSRNGVVKSASRTRAEGRILQRIGLVRTERAQDRRNSEASWRRNRGQTRPAIPQEARRWVQMRRCPAPREAKFAGADPPDHHKLGPGGAARRGSKLSLMHVPCGKLTVTRTLTRGGFSIALTVALLHLGLSTFLS